MYLKEHNYRGAEFRFRDALERKSDQPEATFHLAKSLEMQNKNDEAAQMYRAYLKLQTDGSYAAQARQSLERLTHAAAGKKN
jgi:Tfp pilus assembly protein PilF